MKKILSAVLCIVMLVSVMVITGCEKKGVNPNVTESGSDSSGNTATVPPEIPDVINATVMIKDYGTLKLQLFPKFAPQTVYNFVYLVKQSYYDGVIFDYLDKGVIAQAGSYTVGYEPKTTEREYTIAGEFADNGFDNSLMFGKGMVAMALDRSSSKPNDSAHTNFFICLDNSTAVGLDGKYAAFAQVTEGMEIFDEIQKVEVGEDKRPKTPIEILQITIETDVSALPEPDFMAG